MKKILELLGIEKEEEIPEAIKALKQKAEAVKIPVEITQALDLKENATVSEVKASILALKQSKVVNDDLAKRVKELEEKLLAKETQELVEMALKQGKITPAQKEWAQEYARKDPEGFKVYIQKAPQKVPVGEGFAKIVKTSSDGIDDITLMIAKQMEISACDIKKYALRQKEG